MKDFKEQIVEKIIQASNEQKIILLKDVSADLGIKHIARQDAVDIMHAVKRRLNGYHAVQMMDNPRASLFQSLTWVEDDVEFDDGEPAPSGSADRFRAWLSAAGLTQSECARRFGIPLRTVQNWANGVNEIPSYVFDMMQKLDVFRRNSVPRDFHLPAETVEGSDVGDEVVIYRDHFGLARIAKSFDEIPADERDRAEIVGTMLIAYIREIPSPFPKKFCNVVLAPHL